LQFTNKYRKPWIWTLCIPRKKEAFRIEYIFFTVMDVAFMSCYTMNWNILCMQKAQQPQRDTWGSVRRTSVQSTPHVMSWNCFMFFLKHVNQRINRICTVRNYRTITRSIHLKIEKAMLHSIKTVLTYQHVSLPRSLSSNLGREASAVRFCTKPDSNSRDHNMDKSQKPSEETKHGWVQTTCLIL